MNGTSSRLQAIVSLIQGGNFAKAVRAADDVLRAEPNHFDALHMKALASFYGKDVRGALDAMQKALSIRNDFPEAYNTYGIILKAIRRFDEAIAQFNKAARLRPNYKEALYNIGNCYQEKGELAEAMRFYDAALRLDPKLLAALNNKGLVLGRMGDHPAALECFTRAIRQEPRFAEAYYNRGNELYALNRHDAAVLDYDAALRLKPIFPSAYCNRGNALKALGRLDEASRDYETAIAQDPDFAEAQLSRAVLMSERKQLDRALAELNRILERNPRYAEAQTNRGNVLSELERFNEALESHDEAIRLKPDYAEAYCNRGNVLKEIKRLDAAIASYDNAIKLRPEFAEAYCYRGVVLAELKRFEDALASCDRAVTLKPDYAAAYCNRGSVFVQIQRIDEALADFDAAIRLQPEYFDAQFNKGVTLLSRAEYAAGFELYKARWHTREHKNDALVTRIARWDGNSNCRNLLIWAEQGLGDEVFYASLLSLLDDSGINVSLAADKRLHAIYQRSFPGIRVLDRKMQKDLIDSGFDAQAPIGDLGDILKIDSSRIRARRYPYLKVDRERKKVMLEKNGFLNEKPVCGISWKSANKTFGAEKSMALTDLAPLLGHPNVSFVNLQYGDVASEIRDAEAQLGAHIHHIDDLDVFNDIDGLLALIDACSIVITTSNVTAHLAGAIGKAAIVLVPHGKGRIWYWYKQPGTEWYPSLRVVSQDAADDWHAPIQEAITAMEVSLRRTG